MERLEDGNLKVSNLYIKGLLISFTTSIFLILILSIILSTTSVKESIINPGIIFISSFSILVSSYMISKKIKKKGILNGAIFGIIYMFLIYLISSFINMQFKLNVYSILMISVGILGGIIGGIIGVNAK